MTGGACCTGGGRGDELSVFQLFRKINKAATEPISGLRSPRGVGIFFPLVVRGRQYHLVFLLHFSSIHLLGQIFLRLSMSSPLTEDS